MNRDFLFQQLLRAYRAGIISEELFEAEVGELERNPVANGNGGGFRAFGKLYRSERDAIVSFIDKARVAEGNAAEAFAAWANVTPTDCIRSGLKMIAEREAYHSRIFANRLMELGGEGRAQVSEESRQFAACAADPSMPDNEKLLRVASSIPDPEKAIRPIIEFAESIKDDLETKEALRLFAEDELSSTRWLLYACGALNPSAGAETSSAQ
jgi:rubrerythrin